LGKPEHKQMCGITGILQFDGESAVDRAVLESMNRQIVHRGPDDSGIYTDRNVGIAMRRLSIVDLQSGQQPICNEDGTIWIVFNGEIYNHAHLRKTLEACGHCYRSHSDTETIVHIYEEYGTGCVQHLRGMFAFAIWDAPKRQLFCARDRLGIKPFYYSLDSRRLVFASEIKALLQFPGIKPELASGTLPEYLAFGYLSGSGTMFAGIEKLLPGHFLIVGEKSPAKIQQYWDAPQSGQDDGRGATDYAREYRRLLEEAVESHLMSDVPLGVLLSGGLDSSTVGALMQRSRRDPIRTFSVGYPEVESSELPMARVVAAHIGSNHHEVQVTAQSFFDALPHLIWHEDEPITWPSSVSLYFVSRLAREHVKVVLTGEGSDETLAGYSRYPLTLWNNSADRVYRRLLPAAAQHSLARHVSNSSLLTGRLRRILQHTCVGRDGSSLECFYFDNFYSAFSAADQSELLAPGIAGYAYEHSMAAWKKSQGEFLSRLLYTDVKTYLVELLMKQDNMSMATSIESRVPFLDHVLVEFALRIPAHLKTRGLSGKQILKQAVAGLLPKSVIYQRKRGFPTPWRTWIEGAWLNTVADTLLEPRSLGRGLFRREALDKIIGEQRTRAVDHSDRLWRLFNLELWQRVFLDADATYKKQAGGELEFTGRRSESCQVLRPAS
jgi:asparagine synthase (glutamine-hydrolysing)